MKISQNNVYSNYAEAALARLNQRKLIEENLRLIETQQKQVKKEIEMPKKFLDKGIEDSKPGFNFMA